MYIAESASRIISSASAPDSCSATEMPRLQRSAISLWPATQRHGERLEDPLGGVGRLLAVLDVLEQHRELVAAEARGGVGAADALVEPARDLDQHLVAGRVAEAVVDRLEVVEVEEDHGEPALLAPAARDRVAYALGEQRAVGESRDAVVERLVGELLLEQPCAR